MKRLISLVVLAAMIVLALISAGCRKNSADSGLISFPANSGEYSLLLEGEWKMMGTDGNDRKINLLHNDTNVLVTVDEYPKSEILDTESDFLESYAKGYIDAKLLDAYYANATVGEFTEFKQSGIVKGKRQTIEAKVVIPEFQGVTEHEVTVKGEVIFLELKDYCFAVYYTCEDKDYDVISAKVGELIKNIEIHQNPTTGEKAY